MFDVKERGQPPTHLPDSGLSDVAAINAHARVQLKLVEVQEGMLPVAVPDLRFTYVFATFVNEVTGAVLGTVQLERGGTSANDQVWITPAGIPVAGQPAHVGVRLRLADRSERCLWPALHGVLRPRLVERRRPYPGRTAGADRRSETRGSCPDPVFRTRTLRPRTAAGVSRLQSTSARLIP